MIYNVFEMTKCFVLEYVNSIPIHMCFVYNFFMVLFGYALGILRQLT